MLRAQPRRGGAGKGAPTGIRRVRRRLPIKLAGGVLVVAGLVACNSAEADPEPEPTTPALPETTEADSQPDPVDPDDEAEAESDELDENPQGPQEYEHPVPAAEIDDDGQAGAEAAAVYFVELYSYIYATGDFETWDEITTEDCNFCAGVRERLEDHYAQGGYALAAPPVFESVTVHVQEAEVGDFSVEVIFLSPEVTWVAADGEVVEDFPEVSTRIWVLVDHREGEWVIRGVTGEELE